ncbi:nitroreductase family protein [Desulfobulbus rhabdoformis]|nr:nitroreductase family protein [Desulfobulbus rhabdoformis]
MNSKLTSLFARRSIRKYTQEPIPAPLINDLLEAAMAAPSAMGKNPWQIVALQTRESIDKLAFCLPNGKMLAGATAALLVCGDINQAHDKELSFLLQDTSAAIENILLAASMLGLGACWLGIHPREERIEAVRTTFCLPEGILPVAGISLGWPDEEKEPRTRLQAEQVHFEQW